MKKNLFGNAEILTVLIDELMKDSPNQTLVRRLMVRQGIPYSMDPITQMGTVLTLMDQSRPAKRLRKGEREI